MGNRYKLRKNLISVLRNRRRFKTRTGCYEQGAIGKQEEFLEAKNRIAKNFKKSIDVLENKVKEVS